MSEVIQGLKGTLDANSANETMANNSCTITNIKTKANIFVKHCARFSKLNMSNANRGLNRHFEKHLDAPSADSEICTFLQVGELFSGIKKMKSKGEAGSEIPGSFLKSLGPLAFQELLTICRIGRVATIISLLKTAPSV